MGVVCGFSQCGLNSARSGGTGFFLWCRLTSSKHWIAAQHLPVFERVGAWTVCVFSCVTACSCSCGEIQTIQRMDFERWFVKVVCWLAYGVAYGAIYHLRAWTYREMIFFFKHLTLLNTCRHLLTLPWPSQFTLSFYSACPICLWLFSSFFNSINRF